MNNFYIAFLVYLNLIFIAAKLWNQIEWSWLWVMIPMIAMMVIGAAANLAQRTRQKKLHSEITGNPQSVRNLIEATRAKKEH